MGKISDHFIKIALYDFVKINYEIVNTAFLTEEEILEDIYQIEDNDDSK